MPINDEKSVRVACTAALTLPLEQLHPLQGGLKTISPENAAKLRREIIELGFSAPFHVWQSDDSNYILDGHQRYAVLTDMQTDGWIIPDLPVALIDAIDVSEAKRKLLALASSYGHMTPQSLAEYLEDAGIAFDEAVERYELPDINYETMRELLSDEGFWREEEENKLPDDKIDDVPEVPESFVKPGEIWQLGNHRLMCGDSTKREDVERLMAGEKAELLLTDPPYGVSYIEKNAAVHGGIVKNNIGKKIENDTGSVEEMGALWSSLFSHADHFSNTASYYVFSPQGGELMMMMMMQAIHQSKWQLKHSLIWQKQNFVFGRCDYHYQHEPVLYGWKKKGTHNWYADRSQSSLLQFDKPHKSNLHPTTKPIDILEYLISNSSKKLDLVVDLFLGSGSTLIACEKTNRRCFGMEIDPHYCSVAITRWQDLTGKIAHRVEST